MRKYLQAFIFFLTTVVNFLFLLLKMLLRTNCRFFYIEQIHRWAAFWFSIFGMEHGVKLFEETERAERCNQTGLNTLLFWLHCSVFAWLCTVYVIMHLLHSLCTLRLFVSTLVTYFFNDIYSLTTYFFIEVITSFCFLFYND